MKPLALAGIAIWGILPAWSAAQHTERHGDAPAASQASGSSPAPRASTAPATSYAGRAPTASPARNSGGRDTGRHATALPGVYYPGYWGSLEEPPNDPGGPIITPVQQPADPSSEVRQPAPAPARLEIHEYKVPTGGDDTSAVFSIVSKDGPVLSAIAAWVSNGALHYIDTDGLPAQVPLGSVDREATRRANAEKHLRLWLPAPSEPTRRP